MAVNPTKGPILPRRNVTDPDSLVRIAQDLVAARGVEGTHIGDVAAAAGVSVGTVYTHFPSKDHLIDAVTLRMEEAVVAVMSAAVPPTVPLREAVPDLVEALLSIATQSPALRILSERASTRRTAAKEAPLVRRWIIDIVTAAQQSGELAATDVHLVADLGFALIQAAMTSMATRTDPDEGLDQLPTLLVAAMLGLLPPRSTHPTQGTE